MYIYLEHITLFSKFEQTSKTMFSSAESNTFVHKATQKIGVVPKYI